MLRELFAAALGGSLDSCQELLSCNREMINEVDEVRYLSVVDKLPD
jgi:hypothetical protein